MEKVQLSNRLSAMGHETRLKILQALAERPNGMSSSEIAEHVEVMPTNTSAHLNVLRAAGLISSSKKGRVVTYTLEDAVIKSITREIEKFTFKL